MNILIAVLIDAIAPARMPQLFHRAGCRVTLFSPTYLAVKRSGHVDRYLAAPDDPTEFVEALRRHLANKGETYGWIQPGDEKALRAIAKRFDEDWTNSILPVANSRFQVSLIMDKIEFLSHAPSYSIPVPGYTRFDSLGQLRQSVDKLEFPLMLKYAETMAGQGVHYVESLAHLSQPDCASEAETLPVIAQAWLEGEIGSTEVLFAHGRPVAWINSAHREFWPTRFAASCVRELIDLPEAENLLRRIGTMTNYHGFAGIDWIRNQTNGAVHLIELNPRPTPCYHLGPRVGVDFALAFRDLLEGNQVAVQRPRVPDPKDALVHLFPQYCYRAIDDRAFHRLFRVVRDVPWDDPRLAAALLRRVVTYSFPGSFRARLRRLAGRR